MFGSQLVNENATWEGIKAVYARAAATLEQCNLNGTTHVRTHVEVDPNVGLRSFGALVAHGANCSLSTNNVLNPFTPYGDCSLIRIANLYANVVQLGNEEELAECFEMLTRRSARLIRCEDYGIAVGRPADLVVWNARSAAEAVAAIALPLIGFKRGRRTFSRALPELHRP